MYCTQADLETDFGVDRLIQLTDRNGTGLIDSAVINEAINKATADIDKYLYLYQMPLTVIPSGFKGMCAWFAWCKLNNNNGTLTDDMVMTGKPMIDYLKDLATGKYSIAGAALAGNLAARDVVISIDSSASVFGRGSY